MKSVSCRETGVDCDYVVKGETEEELFKDAEKHARESHNLEQIPDDLKAKMKTLIKDDGQSSQKVA